MLRRRRESEQKRYRTLYGADIEDRKNYDLWLITDDANIDDICEIILAFVSERTRHRDWISKARLVPLTGPPADCAKALLYAAGHPTISCFLWSSATISAWFSTRPTAWHRRSTTRPHSSPIARPLRPLRSADPIDTARRLVSEEQLSAWEACSGVTFSFREMLQSEPGKRKAAGE